MFSHNAQKRTVTRVRYFSKGDKILSEIFLSRLTPIFASVPVTVQEQKSLLKEKPNKYIEEPGI